MDRATIFTLIENERAYQDKKWGKAFDDKNTPNDWVAYIVAHAGKAVTLPWNREAFRASILKVAALCVAALEREEYAPRHYDNQS